jgi:hypothetical protein
MFNWKTLNTLKFIVKSICMMGKDVPDYRQLVYPTVEVLKAVLGLFPSVQYFPFRLQITRLVINIVEECQVNVPLMDVFITMLKTKYFISKQKYQASKTSVDIETTIRIQKDALMIQDLWENIYKEVYCLMVSYLAANTSFLYFPEFSVLFYRLCNSLRKLTTNFSVRGYLKSFVGLTRQAIKRSIQARKGKTLTETKLISKTKDLLMEERQRLAAERQQMIKMKVSAEKQEEEGGSDIEENED